MKEGGFIGETLKIGEHYTFSTLSHLCKIPVDESLTYTLIQRKLNCYPDQEAVSPD
jgi:hypothetical protein